MSAILQIIPISLTLCYVINSYINHSTGQAKQLPRFAKVQENNDLFASQLYLDKFWHILGTVIVFIFLSTFNFPTVTAVVEQDKQQVKPIY
jgi:hypothetical protein